MRMSSAVRRNLARASIVAVLVGGAIAGTAQSASAASVWKLIGHSKTCNYYSFGTICTNTDQYFRYKDAFCKKGLQPFEDIEAYYDYCYKTVTYSTSS